LLNFRKSIFKLKSLTLFDVEPERFTTISDSVLNLTGIQKESGKVRYQFTSIQRTFDQYLINEVARLQPKKPQITP